MRKNKIRVTTLLAGLASICLFSACDMNQQSTIEHTHTLVKISYRKATCQKEGRLAYWHCDDCDGYFLDADASKKVTIEETVIDKLPHTPTKTEALDATCTTLGKMEYWTCSECKKLFSDESCLVQVDESQLTISMKAHDLQHVSATPVVGMQNGVKEHWTCLDCEGYFADNKGTEKIDYVDTILYSVLNIPDFIVEVPTGRDPIVLQLTDTQIMDATQRPDREGVSHTFYATERAEELCYKYLREVITATTPDLIILTGDNIYGEFDVNGSSWTTFVNFMDSFQIPWAPIFGNHDNESPMGVDWQCEQLEKAEYCLFDQKELTGNGNYSVGIAQGDKLTRVFYMLDSNGCANLSEKSKENGHTVQSVGFKQDQIDWFTKQITILKEISPETKISFAYHIQTAVFEDAYAKYGFDQDDDTIDINLDMMEGVTEGDFGYIGSQLKGPWDVNKTLYKQMKELGVDSIFVGHEHENSVSVVYEGIRFQFGQKSSQYDRYNYIDKDGKISNVFGQNPAGTTPLMGGTVIVLSQTDGAIEDSYIYYCGFENGEIDWSQFIEYEVGGLQKGADFDGDGAVSFSSVQFDETTNAYKIYAEAQGKVYINPELLRGKSTVTFTVYVESPAADLAGMGPFAIRLKPDDGSASNIAGCHIDNGKYYINYDVDSVEEARLTLGAWQTFTVDISDIANTCTEFAFLVAKGNTVYLRDVAIF